MSVFCLLLLASGAVSFLTFASGSAYFPKKKAHTLIGEDSHAYDDNFMVVADGLGGTWKKEGIDSGVYARALTSAVEETYYEDPLQYAKRPKSLIIETQRRVKESGASTIVMATLQGRTLHTANFGDSGVVFFRQTENGLQPVYQSAPQQTKFNHPFHLRSVIKRGKKTNPQFAEEFSHEATPGDLVLMASDGYFDNVHLAHTIELLGSLVGKPAQEIAVALAETALRLSQTQNYLSPYAMERRRAQGKRPRLVDTGKEDDITVIVGYVHEYQPESVHAAAA